MEGAIADASEAIRLGAGAGAFLAYEARAWAKHQTGDTEGALADLDEATRIEDLGTLGYWARELIEYDIGHWTEALNAFRQALEPEPFNAAPLFIWILRASNGEREQADAELLHNMLGFRQVPERPFVVQCSRFLLRDLPEDQFLRMAEGAPAADRCRAFFYAGAKHFVEGDRAGAIALYRQSTATGKRYLVEYECAVSDLRRLLVGVYAAPIPKAARGGLPLKEGVGLSVSHVAQLGPAAGAGLRDGDILTTIAVKDASREELLRLLTEGKIGKKVRIDFLRHGQWQTTDLALGVWTPPPRKEGDTDF